MHSDCFLTIEASYQVSWSTKGTSTSYNPTIKIQKRYYKINQKQSNSRATNHNRWFCGRRIRCGPWKSVSGFQLWSPAQRKYSVIYKVSQNPRKKSKTSIAWQKKNQQSDQRKNKANGITSHAKRLWWKRRIMLNWTSAAISKPYNWCCNRLLKLFNCNLGNKEKFIVILKTALV